MLKLLLLVGVLSSICFQKTLGQGINWTKNLSWEEIMLKAKTEKKIIFVDAFATWCIPCKKMDDEVFTNGKVGEVMNSSYISVKIQMDSTFKDDNRIKSWYPIAGYIQEKYKPEGYPFYLFISPEGRLLHKGIGMLSIDKFITLAKYALTDPLATYDIKLKKFNANQLEFASMPDFALEVYKRKDKGTALKIARVYKESFMDRLIDEEAFTKQNLLFLSYFYQLIKSDDRYFKLFYLFETRADSIMGKISRGKLDQLSNRIVSAVIYQEEIASKIYMDGRPISSPQWQVIQNSIKEKYGAKYCERYFPDVQINYYKATNNWKKYALFVEKKIRKNPPKKNGYQFGELVGDASSLNYFAWNVFEGCNDKAIIKRAIYWINLAIELSGNNVSEAYVDTKANLLYKLGRIKKAIFLESKAAALSPNQYEKILDKMKNGLPTWPIK
jgi:thioredoxin-related protein